MALPIEEDKRARRDAGASILAAIDGNQFVLLCQRILPLAGSGPGHSEVLIRLLEEEHGQIPPGAFFPLAEEHGLLPQLDRWMFKQVFERLAGQAEAGTTSARGGVIHFLNVATATLCDPRFPEYVEHELGRTGALAASVCVEIPEIDLMERQVDAVRFARAIKHCGCHVAISGFGRNRATMATLRLVPVDFLKIDGGIVRRILGSPDFLARATAISRTARAIGVRTIAEMVEDDAVLETLRGLKVDFAQGFGISLPQPLAGPDAPDVPVPAHKFTGQRLQEPVRRMHS